LKSETTEQSKSNISLTLVLLFTLACCCKRNLTILILP